MPHAIPQTHSSFYPHRTTGCCALIGAKKGVIFTLIRASEFIILSRAQRADHARIVSELRVGHKSFYRFGIRSCLATSHKQDNLKDAFNMTSSRTLGFQATRPATSAHFILISYPDLPRPREQQCKTEWDLGTRLNFIHPQLILRLLNVGESQSISEANNSGLQTQQWTSGWKSLPSTV